MKRDDRHGVRPGCYKTDWFGTHYFITCERHYHEVKSIDPAFHACAECGHSWRTEEERKRVPGAYCDTCARVAARKGEPAPEDTGKVWPFWCCVRCGEFLCDKHVHATSHDAETGEPICVSCLRKLKQPLENERDRELALLLLGEAVPA